jgi:hypothetical protein
MGFLVNEGDKLTAEKRKEKQEEAQRMYGLSKDRLEALKLPPKTEV